MKVSDSSSSEIAIDPVTRIMASKLSDLERLRLDRGAADRQP